MQQLSLFEIQQEPVVIPAPPVFRVGDLVGVDSIANHSPDTLGKVGVVKKVMKSTATTVIMVWLNGGRAATAFGPHHLSKIYEHHNLRNPVAEPVFKKGDRVIVSDPAGEWIGEIYHDGGDDSVFVSQRDRPTVSYARNQLRLLEEEEAAQAEATEALRAKMERVKGLKEKFRPKHDCRECRHFRPKPEQGFYWCAAIGATPSNLRLSLKAIYGLHIGCSQYESQL